MLKLQLGINEVEGCEFAIYKITFSEGHPIEQDFSTVPLMMVMSFSCKSFCHSFCKMSDNSSLTNSHKLTVFQLHVIMWFYYKVLARFSTPLVISIT